MFRLVLPVRMLIVGFALVLIGGCGLRAVRMNQQAQVYIDFGEYEKAEEVLIESFSPDHENPASHYWLGRCYEETGRPEKAIYEYALAVRFAPALDVAQVAYIKSLYRDGQIDQAHIAAQKYLEYKEAPAREIITLAKNFSDDNMSDLALITYRQAQKNEPDNARPLIEIAEFYFEQGEKQTGLDTLTQAFRVDPLYPGLAARLGSHGLRVSIPQPRIHPLAPTPLQRKLDDLELQ